RVDHPELKASMKALALDASTVIEEYLSGGHALPGRREYAFTYEAGGISRGTPSLEVDWRTAGRMGLVVFRAKGAFATAVESVRAAPLTRDIADQMVGSPFAMGLLGPEELLGRALARQFTIQRSTTFDPAAFEEMFEELGRFIEAQEIRFDCIAP